MHLKMLTVASYCLLVRALSVVLDWGLFGADDSCEFTDFYKNLNGT